MKTNTRKPIVWVLVDLVGSLLLAAGFINLFIPENNFMPEPVRSWPGIPLLILGVLVTIVSMFMFIRRVKQIQSGNS